ncbi:MAG: hypothetical protein R2909_19675 [Gemmatimonadales bacterium]
MNPKRRRWLTWTIGIAVTLALVVWAVAPRRIAVDLATVSEGTLIGVDRGGSHAGARPASWSPPR